MSISAPGPSPTRVNPGGRSPAVSDAGFETLARPALAFPPFGRRKIAAPSACFSEVFAAPPDAGAAPVSNLRLSRRKYTHANCEQQH